MKICKYCGSNYDDSLSNCPNCSAADFKKVCPNCGTSFDSGNFCPNCGVKYGTKKKICPQCSTEYYSVACPNCGYKNIAPSSYSSEIPAQNKENYHPPVSSDSSGKKKCNKYVSLILCIFFGYFGLHKFYEGKIGIGILYLLTEGLFMIGWIVDIISLLGKPTEYYV